MASEILLENATNEIELLEFKIGSNYYGINVAKVKEILPYQPITPIPNSHRCIEGIFMPRDMLITLVDLATALNLPPSNNPSLDMFVVTRFNRLTIAFHVHTVEGIHRISWKDINKPDDTINDENSIATGIANINGRLIIILDFEKIISDICPDVSIKSSSVDKLGDRIYSDKHILIAEDSRMLASKIKDSFVRAGYNNLTIVNNGMEAWKILEKYKAIGQTDDIKCVVTDLEMPVMDGQHLTKLIKNDPELDHIPVIIFSSLVSADDSTLQQDLGADFQLSKPEVVDLIMKVDEILL